MYFQKKLNLTYLLFLILSISFTSCLEEDKEKIKLSEELQTLKSELQERDDFINGLNTELGSINDLFDSLTVANVQLSEDAGLSEEDKIEIIEKVKLYDELLAEGNAKILELESQLKQSSANSSEYKLLRQTVRSLKKQLGEKEEEIGELKITLKEKDFEIREIKSDVIAAKSDLKNAKELINEKSITIDSLAITSKELEKKKRTLQDSLARAEELKEKELYLADANKYYELGKVYYDQLVLVKDKNYLSKKKKERREELAELAYNNFKEAKARNHLEAEKMINLLLYDDKINKFLGIKKPINN